MAGDWIKMRTDLHDDPAVLGMAEDLEIDPDTVVGKLHRFWSWTDRHTSDGKLPGVKLSWIDAHVRCDGFAQAMIKVSWLRQIGDAGVTLPKFKKNNGDGAKVRADAALRQRRKRAKDVTKKRDGSVTREEERRGRGEGKSLTTLSTTLTKDKTDAAVAAVVDAQKDFSWEDISRDANKVAASVPPASFQDRSIILKACFVSRFYLGEGWLLDSAEATRLKQTPRKGAYFTATLQRKAKEAGVTLNAVLKAIDVPPGYARTKGAAMTGRRTKIGDPLTAKQRELLEFIEREIATKGYPPTRRELSEFIGSAAVNASNVHLTALVKKGFVRIEKRKARAIVVIPRDRIAGAIP